jgi:hypothetical protein
MRILNFLHNRVLALAVAMAIVPAAVPSAVPIVGVSQAQAHDHGYRYYGGGGRYHDRGFYRPGVGGPYYGGRYYDRPYYGGRYYRHHRNNAGIGIGAAIIGLGLGAAIANSGPRYYEPRPRYYRQPVYGYGFRSPEWYRYCAARYRSFDPRSGTFQPYHGPRQLCR